MKSVCAACLLVLALVGIREKNHVMEKSPWMLYFSSSWPVVSATTPGSAALGLYYTSHSSHRPADFPSHLPLDNRPGATGSWKGAAGKEPHKWELGGEGPGPFPKAARKEDFLFLSVFITLN